MRSPGDRSRSETLRGTGTLALGQHMSPRTGTWEGGISGAERINLREGFTVLGKGFMDLCKPNRPFVML